MNPNRDLSEAARKDLALAREVDKLMSTFGRSGSFITDKELKILKSYGIDPAAYNLRHQKKMAAQRRYEKNRAKNREAREQRRTNRRSRKG